MRRHVHHEALRLQDFPEKGGDLLLIFDDQNLHGIADTNLGGPHYGLVPFTIFRAWSIDPMLNTLV